MLDLQGCQSASRMRGIGRYCMALAEGIIRNAGPHEVWLLLGDMIPETVMPLRAHFSALLPADRIVVFPAPTPVAEGDPANHARARAAELIREYAIAAIAPDVVHVGSLFEGFGDDVVSSIGTLACTVPTAVTLYDLIPLRNPDAYLNDPVYRAHYLRKIESLKRADALLAISASAAAETIESLDLPASKVTNISAAIDPRFRRGETLPQAFDALRSRIGLTRPFVMHIGVIEPRKNFEGLIRAWAQLPKALRLTHQLLLLAQGPDSERLRLRELASRAGLATDELVLTGHVNDDDLLALYRNCRLLAFPSLHEGFGLPVLEAMACGAVVVTSSTSSLPEVIDFADALFDPKSDADIARALERGLTDTDFREAFSKHALQQCARFSWDETALRAIAAFERIAARASHTTASSAYPQLIEALAALPLAERQWPTIAQAIADNLPPPPTRRLLVDISELAERDAGTGIQRVVRAVLLHLLETPPPEYDVEPVRFDRSCGRYRLARRYLARLRRVPGASIVEDPLLETWRGDVFLGLDLIADRLPQAMPWLARQRRRGMQLAFVAYDTLPLRHPEWWPQGTGAMFERWAELLGREADVVLGISRAVRDDFAAWLAEHGIDRTPRLGWFHLGADVRSSAPSGGMPDDAAATLAAIARAPAFLMVGTLEPRKGHRQALEAFEQLWRDGVCANLVIVGKAGWMVDDLIARLRQHPDRGTRLFWMEGASDEYLEALYRASTVLLAPSEGEGFGLPLIEGALHGLPIIARDLPVFREIAGGHASYFSGDDAHSLAMSIRDWLQQGPAAPRSHGIQCLTWAQSTAQLVAALLPPAPSAHSQGHTMLKQNGDSPASAAPSAQSLPAGTATTSLPAQVDPRMVGLVDAVRAGWYRQDTHELLEGFPISADDTVLDVGCGAGMATIFAAQRGASVIFADVDQAAISALEARMPASGARAWRGIATDSNPLPLDDGIATRVIAMEMLEHVADPKIVMREFARVAAPGALLLFAVPDAASEALQRTVAPDAYFRFPNHIRVLSEGDFESLVTEAGLIIERRHSYSFYWNMAMALFWLSGKGSSFPDGAPSMGFLEPPFPPIVETWARLWEMVLAHPEGEALRARLDQVMPKTRILIARKPRQ
nr:glycosyltransferase [Niveibacterium umoris]